MESILIFSNSWWYIIDGFGNKHFVIKSKLFWLVYLENSVHLLLNYLLLNFVETKGGIEKIYLVFFVSNIFIQNNKKPTNLH
jgi:hypothetical protein